MEHLSDEGSRYKIMEIENEKWMSSSEEHRQIQCTLEILVKRTISSQMEFFKNDYLELVEEHIQHPYLSEMKKRSDVVGLSLRNTIHNS